MSEPYYSDDLVTLYHGDCREILPALPYADAIEIDPYFGRPKGELGALAKKQQGAKPRSAAKRLSSVQGEHK